MVYTYPKDNYYPKKIKVREKVYLQRITVEQSTSRVEFPLILGRLNVIDFHYCELV